MRQADRLKRDLVLGDEAFVDRFKAWRNRASREVPRRERTDRPPLEVLFAGACTRSARNACIGNAYAAGYSVQEMAHHLGVNRCTVDRALVGSGARSRKMQQCET